MHPRIVVQHPQIRVALNGFLNLLSIFPNHPANGVASSLAIVHSILPHVTNPPGIVNIISRTKIARRPVAPATELVPWWNASARGRETMLELRTASKSVIAYRTAM